MDLIKVFETRRRLGYEISEIKDIYVIAEIGINHNGDIAIAKKLMDVAKNAGCDAVKFQKRTIGIVYSESELNKERISPWGKTNRDQKNGLEFSPAQYEEIWDYAYSLGIDCSASAWDIDSLNFIEKFNPPFHKVASAFITNIPFLVEVAKLGRPTFVSVGMSTMEDIATAVQIFKAARTPITLFHTVSTYPSKIESLNLLSIPMLQDKFKVPVGYSGHETSTSPTLIACALGAVAIERHITLDRSMYGSDQSASLEPEAMNRLVGSIRKLPFLIGDGVKKYAEGEADIAKKLRYWE
jgi:N-acetylneuraminate synthase